MEVSTPACTSDTARLWRRTCGWILLLSSYGFGVAVAGSRHPGRSAQAGHPVLGS
jgi:hypothetical protein